MPNNIEANHNLMTQLSQAAQPSQNAKTYSYNISCGPLRFKGEGNLKRDMANLEKILGYLDQPSLTAHKESRVFTRLSQVPAKISVRLHRVLNFLFGDHQWYSEARVRKILKSYSGLPAAKKTAEFSEKALMAFDHLERIGDGSFVKNIDRSQLETSRWSKLYASLPEMPSLSQLYESLPEMPRVNATLNKTVQVVATIVLLSIHAYFNGNILKGKKKATVGAKAIGLGMQLLLDASKDLNLVDPKVKLGAAADKAEPKKTLRRSQSVSSLPLPKKTIKRSQSVSSLI